MAATAIGIFKLNADAWVRAFLAIAVLYLVTSAFTLAKVIRDRQDGRSARVDSPASKSSERAVLSARSVRRYGVAPAARGADER